MTRTAEKLHLEDAAIDWVDVARELGPTFAERAAEHDREGSFVHRNYHDMAERKLFSMSIPSELGGGGASFAVVCETVRELGRHCGSTALAFAMHTHPVATNVFKHLRGDAAAARTLGKIAETELVIAGTGANDWLSSSGEAERVDGGWRVTAHKRFVSGSPGAHVFVTSVSHEGPDGREVLHFAVPFSEAGVDIVESWNALGMRGTGSHEVKLDGVFVPDEAIVARRPADVWHPMYDAVIPTAMPLITAAYVGMAEAAAEHAKRAAAWRGAELAPVVGEMTTRLTVAQLALEDMIRLNRNHGFVPTLANTDAILTRKALATESVKAAVELAAELVGGPGFSRGHPVERIVRDVRAMHYHPLPARRQQAFSGRIALGLDPVTGV